jgi:hypothetical protein
MVMIAALFLPKNFTGKSEKIVTVTNKEVIEQKNNKKIPVLLKGRVDGYSKKENGSSTGTIATFHTKNDKAINRKSKKNI